MRPHGKAKLGFFPLPVAEAERLRACLSFPSEFSALDACVGDGVAFTHLLKATQARRYGIEIDANRVEQARSLGIETQQANTMDVRCPAEAFSLLYLNPPYDLEVGQTNNQRLELVFLEHTYRWLKCGGVLLFVIPQPQLKSCARVLGEHFTAVSVFKLTEPASVQYKQVVVFGVRRKRHQLLRDSALLDAVRWLEALSSKTDLQVLSGDPPSTYEAPPSGPAVLTNGGIPLDEVEDLLLDSAAYRQTSRLLLPKQRDVRGRPLTPLHGGHVGLLCTAGMLNGIFGEGEDRHIAHWRSLKFTDHWEEEEEDGTKILHDRESFSHELTLVFANGKTQILTHEKKDSPNEKRTPPLRLADLREEHGKKHDQHQITARSFHWRGFTRSSSASQSTFDFCDRSRYADCRDQCRNLHGRPVHGGRAGRSTHPGMPGTECAMFQRLHPACRAKEAPAPSHRHVGRVCFGQRVSRFRQNAVGRVRQPICLGLHRAYLWDSGNSGMGRLVRARTRYASRDRFMPLALDVIR